MAEMDRNWDHADFLAIKSRCLLCNCNGRLLPRAYPRVYSPPA